MKVKKLGNVVCIVVTGEFNPQKVTAQRVIDYDLVTKEESCQIETQRLDSSLSVFTIAKQIDVMCSKNWIQVSGAGSVSDRIPDLTKKLLNSSGFERITSVGVNAFWDFDFHNHEDRIQFGNFFIPLGIWQDYLREGRVSEFTMRENGKHSYPDYKKSISIKSLLPKSLPNGQIVSAVRMSVNYDFQLETIDDCFAVINRSLSLFDEFWKDSDSIIDKVS